MNKTEWGKHAYPLQQMTVSVQLQGTRHSERQGVVGLLDDVVRRIKAGEVSGEDHDDDFGYRFNISSANGGATFFDDPAGYKGELGDLQGAVTKQERDFLVDALQALYRERLHAYNVAERVAIERNAAPADRSAFGLEAASAMLRRFGAAPNPA